MRRQVGAVVAMVALLVTAGAAHAATKPTRTKVARLAREADSCRVMHPQRCEPLATLVAFGPAASRHLQNLLTADEPGIRAVAITALGEVGTRELGEKLLRFVKETDPRVRLAAIGAVGSLRPDGAVEALARALGSSLIGEKLTAITALGRTGSPGAVTPLIRALDHFNPQVKAHAARTLAELGDRQATLPIAALLADPVLPVIVRKAACAALSRLGDPSGVPMLLLASADPDQAVRMAAIEALGQLKDARGVGVLTHLARDERTALAAVTALGFIGDRSALPALVRLAKERPAGDPVVEKVFWALGGIREAPTVTALAPFLTSADARIVGWAADALGRVGRAEAIEPLVASLEHDDSSVKEMVAWSLQQLTGVDLGHDPERWRDWLAASKPAP